MIDIKFKNGEKITFIKKNIKQKLAIIIKQKRIVNTV